MNAIIKARINWSVNLKKADDLNMSSCNPIKKDKIDPIKIRFNWFINLKSTKSWKKKIFERNHIVIIHREKNSNDFLENLIKIKIIKKYGRSKIIFGTFN